MSDIQAKVKALLSQMTLQQKIGQIQQMTFGDQITPQMQAKITKGEVGSFLNTWSIDQNNQLQQIAMTKARLKIPLLIGKDVIHGFRTVTPIPLAQGASFSPEHVTQCARNSAQECSSIGIRWTFSPMVDIARDPRWGRIAQGSGEDPFLAGTMGVAMVKGYQGKGQTDITSVAACGKHYVGYGATQGGRDYNTTLIPENTLRDVYLSPFKQLADAGILTYMSAFNDLNGQPSTANEFTLKQVLRKEWNFTGLVVTDYNAVGQLIVHGIAEDEKDAASKAINSGIDMEMVSTCCFDNLAQLIKDGKVTIAQIDNAVSNILRVKFKLGLFQSWSTDPARQSIILNPKFKEDAKQLALRCPVLLQNKNGTLPINSSIGSLAVIGGLADDPQNQIGCWSPDGKKEDSITPLTSLKTALTKTKINYAQGYKDTRSKDTSLFAQAIAAATVSDKVLLFLGQDNGLSGQSNCRSEIGLPGCQLQLVKELSKVGKPIVAIIYAGRSLLLQQILPLVDTVLYAWHLGSMAGPALSDLILGVTSPSGKLPVTFLRSAGQIPLYYNHKNTGRPNNTHEYIPYTSSYIDIDSTPLYPFGYGLSYNTFSYSGLKHKTTISIGDSLLVTASIKNEGARKAEEIVFLFVRDLVGSYTRPVKQLKAFKRLVLEGGQTQNANFIISTNDLRFWTKSQEFKVEPGKFQLFVGRNSEDALYGQFEVLASGMNEELIQKKQTFKIKLEEKECGMKKIEEQQI